MGRGESVVERAGEGGGKEMESFSPPASLKI